MTTPPIISICIPTKNQPKKLELLLQNLLSQPLEDLEIIIIDDGLGDATEKMVEKYRDRLPVHYYQGEHKGFDSAIVSLVEKAIGRYIWWIGDDIIGSGAVAKIINTIQKFPDISFFWLNSRNINDPNDLAFRMGSDRFISDKNEPIEIDLGMLCFASTTILKRSKILEAVNSAKGYVGSSVISLYFVLWVLAKNEKCYYIQQPYILSESKPSGEKRWYDQFQVFCINIFKVATAFDRKFKRKSIRIALRKNLRQCIKAVLVERAMGFHTGFGSHLPKIVPMMRCYWSYWEAWAAIPFFILPRPLLRHLYSIYKKLISTK